MFWKQIAAATGYREAQAWVFVLVNAIVMVAYGLEVFANRGLLDGQGLPAFAGLIIVGVCTTFYTILLIIPTAIVFNRTANEKADERDRRIRIESGALAFWAFFATTGMSLVAYIFHSIGDLLFHSILIAVLFVQLTYALGIAVKYRRSGAPILTNPLD